LDDILTSSDALVSFSWRHSDCSARWRMSWRLVLL